MKTDRELLELAAKAVGIELMFPTRASDVWPRRKDTWDLWNPLVDDGDAFRLGVACRAIGSREVAHHRTLLCLVPGYDRLELERRAIVSAVAEAQQSKEVN